jgi:hypothetical protein
MWRLKILHRVCAQTLWGNLIWLARAAFHTFGSRNAFPFTHIFHRPRQFGKSTRFVCHLDFARLCSLNSDIPETSRRTRRGCPRRVDDAQPGRDLLCDTIVMELLASDYLERSAMEYPHPLFLEPRHIQLHIVVYYQSSLSVVEENVITKFDWHPVIYVLPEAPETPKQLLPPLSATIHC